MPDLPQHFTADFPLLPHAVVHLPIARIEQQAARGRTAVPPRATSLLVVILERAGMQVMQHEPDVWLVDPHAKGIGRHDHLTGAAHECVLRDGPALSSESRVIGHRVHAA